MRCLGIDVISLASFIFRSRDCQPDKPSEFPALDLQLHLAVS